MEIAGRKLMRKVAGQTMRWNFRMWGFGEAVAIRGLMAAHLTTSDGELAGYATALLRAYVARGAAPSPEEHVAPARELLLLYRQNGEEDLLEAACKLAALHASFPVNSAGARMHRPDLPGWRRQIWADCMDAEPPFLAMLGCITGERQYSEQALAELSAYTALLHDSETGLYRHGYEEACGPNGQFWARGNGWALMGLVETINLLPESQGRAELTRHLATLCRSLQRYQSPEGLWHTVVPAEESYLESTLAVMAAYALREAFAAGILSEREFGEMERRARAAALRCVNEDGVLEKVTDATPVSEYRIYTTRPFGIFPWGQGPLLLMLSQNP